ncbi:hypothetical protein GGI19_000268 [Coemansia pectinata]|uniref:Uncharacterized protein n=1 Tax=Coemansia pectinata TaxID=1052879 RepID=A0A9W8LEJ6_9FUNG|nr:hypothetical protein GGI19_000268 [Coemansia pectinata]
MDSSSRSVTNIQPAKNANTLVGENFSFGTVLGTRCGDVELLLQNTLPRNCNNVCQLATPCDQTLSTVARELAENIAADFETRLNNPEPRHIRAYNIILRSDAFLLFVVHHIKAHFGERVVAGILKSENCRLVLPVANEDTKRKRANAYPVGYRNYKAFAHAECDMFALSGGSVERQVGASPHIVVTNVEVAANSDELNGAVPFDDCSP